MWYYSCIFLLLLSSYVSSQNADNCKCISFHLCRQNEGTIITDGEGLLNERLGALCPDCKCTGVDVCCYLVGNVTTRGPEQKGCGHSNPDGTGAKISGDAEDDGTMFGEFPWMVAILENNEIKCGGSLIHPSVVLTAAHCLKKDQYVIRAGEWDRSGTNEVKKHQDRSIASIKKHENFNPKNFFNDVALLFVNEPFKLDVHINTACLTPPKGVETGRCTAIGWGKNRFSPQGNYSELLKKVELPIVPQSTCQENMRKTRLGPYFNLHESFICAGGEKDKDVCTGDGGGPLFCPIDGQEDRYQQVGIVAWGLGCNDENVPGVFTNVANLRGWIDKQMTDNNLKTDTYQF